VESLPTDQIAGDRIYGRGRWSVKRIAAIIEQRFAELFCNTQGIDSDLACQWAAEIIEAFNSPALPHSWVPSTLGHGEVMCKYCHMTNREAAALHQLDDCSGPG